MSGRQNPQKSSNSSLSALITSIIVNGAVSIAFIFAFTILRKKLLRIYEPKAFLQTVPKSKRTNALPPGMFSWIMPLAKTHDETLLNRTGLDGYFFLRYLRTMSIVSGVGVLCLWPVLLPVNATGGNGATGLDRLSFSNVQKTTRMWAHLIMAWVFIGFFLFTIYRELHQFISIRRSYLQSVSYASRSSARTLLLTSIPSTSESDLRNAAPGITEVWINQDLDELEDKIEEREKLVMRLEKAGTKLVSQANKNASKNNVARQDSENIASRYISDNKRPHHRLGKFGLYGKKVDTLNHCRSEIARLNEEITNLQNSNQHKLTKSAFVQFQSQDTAQTALKSLPKSYEPRYIGIQPREIVWKNTHLTKSSRSSKATLAVLFVLLLILFWAIPVAIVGIISNVTYLQEKVPFLRFLNKMPSKLYGIITGLLPAILLSVLMSLVPVILRLIAKKSGVPSDSLIELWVQKGYFAFQVIQVFLVTTLASAATSTVTQIINNPSSATTLLSENLPKASNFYISFLILQGLSVAAGKLLQIGTLIAFYVLGKLLDKTPRQKWIRYNKLSELKWGSVLPPLQNLAVIVMTYSIIAPLIMVFAAVAFLLFYVAYSYNCLYVNYNSTIDTRGAIYPRALWSTMTGIYLLEVCLLGLFSVRVATPQIVLLALTIIITAAFQIWLQRKLKDALEYIVLDNSAKLEEGHLVARSGVTAGTSGRDAESLENSTAAQREEESSYDVDGKPLRDATDAYRHPALISRQKAVWIPKDKLGVSQEEVDAALHKGVQISNDGAAIGEKNKIVWTSSPPGYEMRQNL